MGKRVMCQHCEGWFFPEEGVSLDDCPKCGRTVEVPPDHIADATKKAQPARCPHCGYTADAIPSGSDAYAQANCEHRESHAELKPAPRTPAPLPEEDGEICTRLLSACNGHPHALIPWPHRLLHDAVAHISDLTRRLAEAVAVKASLSNVVEMVKHGLNGPWEPGGDVAALAKEAGDALQAIGSAVGDWDWYHELPAKVKAIQARAEDAEARVRELEAEEEERKAAQDLISDLTRRLAEAEAELAEVRRHNGRLAVQRADAVHLAKANPTQAYQRIQQFKERAEAAEARVRELEAELSGVGVRQYREAVERLHKAEAFKARVTEWARGNCCACSGMTEDKYGQRVLYTEKCYGCVEYSGDDDAVSLWAPAWEVGE